MVAVPYSEEYGHDWERYSPYLGADHCLHMHTTNLGTLPGHVHGLARLSPEAYPAKESRRLSPLYSPAGHNKTSRHTVLEVPMPLSKGR